ncbi:hypothetical protein BLA29_004223 [Euroglyphus maynei]|uniref:Uncharacterized protein n=1 Tax=Euroglyphus maynei TaxID=6958 RepID=A0A1Y3BAJ2_EURMA|nr:hypothetical protein BLA29_004223 [Euroglyphus maynei]
MDFWPSGLLTFLLDFYPLGKCAVFGKFSLRTI